MGLDLGIFILNKFKKIIKQRIQPRLECCSLLFEVLLRAEYSVRALFKVKFAFKKISARK